MLVFLCIYSFAERESELGRTMAMVRQRKGTVKMEDTGNMFGWRNRKIQDIVKFKNMFYSIALVILGQILSIATCGCWTHTKVIGGIVVSKFGILPQTVTSALVLLP